MQCSKLKSNFEQDRKMFLWSNCTHHFMNKITIRRSLPSDLRHLDLIKKKKKDKKVAMPNLQQEHISQAYKGKKNFKHLKSCIQWTKTMVSLLKSFKLTWSHPTHPRSSKGIRDEYIEHGKNHKNLNNVKPHVLVSRQKQSHIWATTRLNLYHLIPYFQ